MNFSCLSEKEVRESYRFAANKKDMLRVLADLTCSKKTEVMEFLGLDALHDCHETRMALYQSGMNDREIANELDISSATIFNWRKKHGLPSNVKAGGQKKGGS